MNRTQWSFENVIFSDGFNNALFLLCDLVGSFPIRFIEVQAFLASKSLIFVIWTNNYLNSSHYLKGYFSHIRFTFIGFSNVVFIYWILIQLGLAFITCLKYFLFILIMFKFAIIWHSLRLQSNFNCQLSFRLITLTFYF